MTNNNGMHNLIFNKNIKVFSFDFFDTVITRSVSRPADIFVLMQKIIEHDNKFAVLPAALRGGFPVERVKAEEDARNLSGHEEIRLNSIYERLAAKFSFAQEVALSLMDLEIQTEMGSIFLIREIKQAIDEIRSRNKRVIFVSDMYLSAGIIKKMLICAGCYHSGDGLYVSSEYRLSKVSGNLFRKILELENCKPNEILHIGDNQHSDFLIPARIGIKAAEFLGSKENRFEKVFSNIDGQAEHRFVAGAMRAARLMNPYADKASNVWYDLGCDIAGPILVNYVIWVLKKAAGLGLKRLYFLSRDGQVLLSIAERIINRLNINIELRYLYGSRQAWNLASTTSIDEVFFAWLLRKDPFLTLEIIAKRSEQNVEDLKKGLQNLAHTEIDITKELNDREIVLVKGMFCSAMKGALLEKAAGLRGNAIGYFRQEGLFEQEILAVIDLGWQGSLQNSLRKLFDCAGHAVIPIYGFYFGLYADNYASGQADEKFTYFFSPQTPRLFKNVTYDFIKVIEAFTAADHGIVLNYLLKDEKPAAVIKPLSELESANIENIKKMREGVISFLNLLPGHYFNTGIQSDVKPQLHRLIELLMHKPEKRFADGLGDFYSSSDQAESKLMPIAPSLSAYHAFMLGLTRHSKSRKHYTHWSEASRSRSSFTSACLLSFRAQKVLGKIGLFLRSWAHN